jgi:RHS repeat-associated protein
MIRLTKLNEPLQIPNMRVEFLPLAGPGSCDFHGCCSEVFEGPVGFHKGSFCEGDPCPFVYAVTSVDSLGNESALSNKISVHTDATDRTDWDQPSGCYQEAKNSEISNIPLTIPDPNSPALPAAVTGPTWSWKYGRDPNSDVGPEAGNWALVKWPPLPSNNTANDYRLQRRRAADPNWVELDLDLIPGDDEGVRQFIWAMPLELACEDANYQVVGVDYYGNRGTAAAITFVSPTTGSRHNLIPENVRATASGTQVTVSWDPLPLCGQDSTHVLTGYTLQRSKSWYSDCSGPVPAEDQNLYNAFSSGSPSITSLMPNLDGPTSRKYWYRVYASWGQSGASEWSPGMCISADEVTSQIFQPRLAPSIPASPEASWTVAQLGEPGMWAEDLWRGEVSEVCEMQSLPTSCDAERGPKQADMMSQLRWLDVPRVPEDAATEPDAESPHRVIGQGSITPAERLTFYHVDHLGTPRVITDPNGNVVSKHKYLPFGEELSAPPSSNTHEFTGHERDAETGLDYMLARYYSSGGTFRFASADPGDDTDMEDPQRWNSYTYVRNNPLRLIDPLGMHQEDTEEHYHFQGEGAQVTALRFDPNKDDGPVEHVDFWWLDYVGGGGGKGAGLGTTILEDGLKAALAKTAKEGAKEAGKVGARAVAREVVAKAESAVWKKLKAWRGKTKTNGESGGARRYYEWDHQEGHIEVYDLRGKHLGKMDPQTGEMIQNSAVEGRGISVK